MSPGKDTMTNTQTPTIQDLAVEAYDYFEIATRPDGEEFTRVKPDSPAWLTEMVQEAHGNFLPDNWRYDCIRAACSDIADNYDPDDGDHQFADSYVDVYTANLLLWFSSNLNRAEYCDDAIGKLGYDEERGIIGAIAMGQYYEAREVYAAVLSYLERMNDES